MPGAWKVDERTARSAGALHGSWPAVERDPTVRRIGVCRPVSAAVVLGSTQSPEVAERGVARAAGIDVVRRRSGGGAVLVTPDDPVWVDAWLPVGDPLWTADVTAAFGWLGAAWSRALARMGIGGVEVQGPSPGACTRWSSLVCFGGIGAGEVMVRGRKVVGLAQRRNRSGAWFHGACLVRWDPAALLEVLDLPPGERAAAAAGLAEAAVGLADVAAPGRVPTRDTAIRALVDSLPHGPVGV